MLRLLLNMSVSQSEESCLKLWQVLGNFYCTPSGELNTHLCLYVVRLNEQCIGQSPTSISSSARSVQRCVMSWVLICTCTSSDPVSINIRHLRLVLGSFPQHQFCLPEVALEHSVTSISYLFSKCHSHSLTGSPSVSGISASSQLNLFCSWAFLPKKMHDKDMIE